MLYIVSQFYDPETNPPANRMGYLAGLIAGDHGPDRMRVVAGRPTHPDGILPPGYRWRWWKKRTGRHGESIIHLYEFPAANRGAFRKTLGMLSYGISVGLFFLFRRMKKDDLVYVTSPPVFASYALYLLSFIKPNLRYLLEVRDLHPQSAAAMGLLPETSWLYRLLLGLSERSIRRASAVCGVVEGIVDYLGALRGEAVPLIYNTVDTSFFERDPGDLQAFREAHPELDRPEGGTVFLFAGTHYPYMGLPYLMQAIDRLRESRENFKWLIVGSGEDTGKIQAYATEHGVDPWVVFVPFLPREELARYIAIADFCYVPTVNDPLFEMIIPTKTLEYLAAGKFVLTALNCPFARRLEEAGHALNSMPEDVDALRANMVKLIDERDEILARVNGKAFVEEHFALPRFEERMRAFLEPYRDSFA